MNDYKVILFGARDNTLEGLENLKSAIAGHFGSSPETIDEMFAQLPVTLEENLSQEAAQVLIETFNDLGGDARIENDLCASTSSATNINTCVSISEIELCLQESTSSSSRPKKETPPPEAPPPPAGALDFVLDEMPETSPAPSAPSAKQSLPELDLNLTFDEIFAPAPADSAKPNNKAGAESPAQPLAAELQETTTPSQILPSKEKQVSSKSSTHSPTISSAKNQVVTPTDIVSPKISSPTSHSAAVTDPRHFNFGNKKLLCAAGGGLALLVIIALIFFSSSPAKPAAGFNNPELVDKLLAEQRAILQPSSDDSSTATASSSNGLENIIKWQQVVSLDNFEATINITVQENNVVGADLVINKSVPKKPSQEEVLRGTLSLPWLDRVTVISPNVINPEADRELPEIKITMPSRAYVKDGLKAAIIYPSLEISGTIKDDTISGYWQLSDNNAPPDVNGVTPLPNSHYAIYYRGELALKEVTP